jgi:N6-adenosine-specific RNA methylase IME4
VGGRYENHQQRQQNFNTQRKLESVIRYLVASPLGELRLDAIRTADINSYVTWRMATPLSFAVRKDGHPWARVPKSPSAATVNKSLQVLKSALRFAQPDEKLKALDVARLAAPDGCHLYLWTTAPKLEVAYQVLRAWGFDFKTVLVWRKRRLGLGRHFRSQTEFILFATRGPNLPLREQGLSNVVDAPVARHSEKPDAFYALAERASFEPRLDMFARKPRPGWTVWGAEAPVGPRPPAIHKTGAVINPLDEVLRGAPVEGQAIHLIDGPVSG